MLVTYRDIGFVAQYLGKSQQPQFRYKTELYVILVVYLKTVMFGAK